MIISDRIRALGEKAEEDLREPFARFDRLARFHTERVLDVFREHRVSEAMFAPSTGYGYGDAGRDAADRVLRDVFRAEAGFVRAQIISGTHALTIGLFALLRPGDTLLSATGAPYDTLLDVVGTPGGPDTGSLRDFGVRYEEIPLDKSGRIDLPAVTARLKDPASRVRVVFIQRSKGYFDRRTLSPKEIGEAATAIKAVSSDTFVFVDNCYGEFTSEEEPVAFGVDLMAGSLIKNPGGGMADTGGYLCGSARATELAANRLSSPGVGLEAGASLGQTRNILKGLFYAPHTVAQALKTAAFAASVFESLGFDVNPGPLETRYDIIQTVRLGSPEKLVRFCRGIQSASPVDSFVSPEPWAMPGYPDPVVMAAGAFTGGSSIELSADGPIRPPYTAYLQGGLTYEAGRLGILRAAEEIVCNP